MNVTHFALYYFQHYQTGEKEKERERASMCERVRAAATATGEMFISHSKQKQLCGMILLFTHEYKPI
jgi:hypothetical protein